MNKSAASFCKRLYQSITEQYGEEKAEEICGKGVGASANVGQRGRWAAETMERVAAGFDETSRIKVMAGCACGPGQAQLDAARKIWSKCNGLEEYCERRNEEMKGGAHFETRAGLLYISYPHCYCPMIKNSPVPISSAWCLCSCEYARRACSHAFERPVDVKLLKSSCAGDDECLFEVRIQWE